MKKGKIIWQLILFVAVVMIFAGTARIVRGNVEQENKDKVVLRFAVTSKTFAFDEGNFGLRNFIGKVYEYADHCEYTGVDAFIINGNVTGDGSAASFEAVDKIADELLREESCLYTTMGEMDFMVGETNEVNDPEIREKIVDYSVSIKGHDFIFLSPVYDSYASKLDWLDEELSQISKYGSKPIFVFQFAALKNTFYGSETWYSMESDKILEVLEKYDRVVDFASSTASPSNTVRSIYQNNATYVNTGVLTQVRLNYQEFGNDTSAEVIHPAISSVSQCKIVEVYGDGKIDILTMDLNTGNLYKMPDSDEVLKYEFYAGKKESYPYTREKNNSAEKPVFREDAKVEIVSMEQGRIEINFPHAADEDGILFYKIKLLNKASNVVQEYNTYSDFALYEMPKKKTYVLENLETGADYHIEIIPYDMFGVTGEPISIDFEAN